MCKLGRFVDFNELMGGEEINLCLDHNPYHSSNQIFSIIDAGFDRDPDEDSDFVFVDVAENDKLTFMNRLTLEREPFQKWIVFLLWL